MAATQRHSVEEVHELSKNSKVWVPNNEDGWISGNYLLLMNWIRSVLIAIIHQR